VPGISNPGQVDRNRRSAPNWHDLSALGYQEVAPPATEHSRHAPADCAGKPQNDVLRLASEETAGVAARADGPRFVRAASTRWPPGHGLCGGGLRARFSHLHRRRRRPGAVSERLQSGVELARCARPPPIAELMRLLLACTKTLGLKGQPRPLLLVGSHGVLGPCSIGCGGAAPRLPAGPFTIQPPGIGALGAAAGDVHQRRQLLAAAGQPARVLPELQTANGPDSPVAELATTLEIVAASGEAPRSGD